MDAGSVQRLPPAAEKDALTSVNVAVNIRPLIPSEHLQGCTDCITDVPGEPQTGSGKTYTMGTGHTDDTNSSRSITPKMMESIFEKIEAQKSSTEFLVRVSFIEGIDLLKNYATKIQRQEAEILHLKNLCQLKQDSAVDCFDLEDHESSFCNNKDATF